jgi:serine/threonine protein kinase
MNAADDPADRLLSTDGNRVQEIAVRFEEAWQAGRRPSIADYWPAPGVENLALLVELVHTELEYRLKAGEPVRVEAYRERYPELAADPGVWFGLIATEYRLRQRREPELTLAEYVERFPDQAAQLAQHLATQAAGPHLVAPPSTVRDGGVVPDVWRAPAPPQIADYEILGELGRGGMGVVYRAFDRRRRVPVALKTLPRLEPTPLYRFKQEFRSLVGVTHPNLVTLYELVAEGQTWFFTMEYVEGAHFLAHVRPSVPGDTAEPTLFGPPFEPPSPPTDAAPPALPSPPMDVDHLRAMLRQLAEGLQALHAAGKLHRDIKPSNVLVTPAGRVVVLDFGLAAELDPTGQHQSVASGVVGTVAYMAPEQAAGRPVSPASDWYSVGVVLFEALTGRLPFCGVPRQVLHDKQDTDPAAPIQWVPGVPEDLNRLCQDLLQRDPARRPTGPEVLQRLGRAEARPAGPAPLQGRPLFVGRQTHLALLEEPFAAVQQGRTVALSIHGPSGAGKSALVQHFLDGLGERAVVLAGRCYEQESVPYKALDSLVDALSRYLGHRTPSEVEALLPRDVLHLARLFPVLQRVRAIARAPVRSVESADPHEARRRATAALRELLARLGDRRPLVLFIDDVQWGDQEGAAVLADLLRPPDPPVLLLLVAYRSDDAPTSPFLRAYLGPEGVAATLPARRELVLDALTAAEAADLAVTLLGRSDPDTQLRAQAVARESGGSPFFVYELVQYLQAGAGPAPLVPGQVSLNQVLWTRITCLPEEARRLLEFVAVAGRPVREADACQAAGLAAGHAALSTLQAGRLVRTQRRDIDTYHDRIRETVLAHLSPAARADAHRRLAEALEAGGATDPEVLAIHFHGSGQAERARRSYAEAAAQAADALAFEHAARLYRRVLELGPPGGPDQRVFRTRLGDALANAGRGSEAAREYQAAAVGACPKEALELQRQAALQFLVSGHVDEGIRTLGPVLDAVGMRLASTPVRALLVLLARRAWLWLRGAGFRERAAADVPAADLERIDVCWSVTIGLIIIDPIRSAPFLSRGLQLALQAGEPRRIARVLAIEAAHIASAGWWAKRRGMTLLQVADDLAGRLGEPHALGMIALMRGASAYLEGRWKAGVEGCDHAERIFRERCVGVAWELDTTRIFALWSLNFMGELAELSRRWHEYVQEARQRGDLYALTNLRTFNMSMVRLAADQPEEARREMEEAIAQWSQKGYHVQHHNALLARVPIALYTGDAAGAWAAVTRNWRPFWSAMLGRIQNLRVQMLQMRAYSALALAQTASDREALLRVARRDARRLRRERIPWPAALAEYIHAVTAALRGDREGACRLLPGVITAFEVIDMGLYAAATRRRLGDLIGGAEGQALVAQADAWMAGQNIRNPARMTAVYAPGFPDAACGVAISRQAASGA